MRTRRSSLFLTSLLLAACAPQPRDAGQVVLSYEKKSPWCANCPHYRVEFSSAGMVRFFGFSGVGVPGEQALRVPPETFFTLRRSFDDAAFFDIPRLDTSRIVMHTDVVTIAYRDDRRVHEVIDAARAAPHLDKLKELFLQAAKVVDHFISPSADTYQRLLADGWQVNTIGTDGENALTNAVVRDRRAARLLLERGATVSRDALRFAVPTGDVDLVRLLIAARRLEATSAEAQELLAIAARHNTPMMSLVLDAGTDPNGKAGEGTTPLSAAVSSGSAERVRLLLSRGADPRRAENILRTALYQNDSGIIAMLVRGGADVNAHDKTGRTALIAASDQCSYWHIEALLAAGANPAIASRDGRTALQPENGTLSQTESCKRSRATLEKAVRR